MTVVTARATERPGPLSRVDPALAADVSASLAEVEARLRAAVDSDHSFVSVTARHLVDAGGKRFRPLVALIASHTGNPREDRILDAAVALELTHLATLYHDDVMDEAALRRGAPTANHRWGNSVAILAGDYLFARASEIAAGLGSDVVRLLALTLASLCEGQLRETQGPGPDEDPVEHYLSVVRDKTASLIAAACRLGAQLAGADPATVLLLEEYGTVLGTAFQIADDLLDIEAESGTSGKTAGTDLREGVRTLPVLYALRPTADADGEGAQADGGRGDRLRALLASDLASDEAALAEALGLLRGSPAMLQARLTLATYVDRCREIAAQLPPGPVADALVSVSEYVVTRTA